MILHVLLATPLRVEFFFAAPIVLDVLVCSIGLCWSEMVVISYDHTLAKISTRYIARWCYLDCLFVPCLSPVWGIIGMKVGPINGSILLTLVLLDVV